MGKIAKKGNKKLFEITDKIHALLGVDSLHDIYQQVWAAVKSDNLEQVLSDYTALVADEPEQDWIQRMFLFSGADSARMGQDFTPESIAKLTAAVSDYSDAKTVLDVCGGTGALTLALHKRHPGLEFTILEADHRVIGLLLFNLALHNVWANVVNMDVLTGAVAEIYEVRPGERFGHIQAAAEEYKINQFDIVISNPPFNVKAPVYHTGAGFDTTDGNVAFLDYCVSHLKNSGRAGIILMDSFLGKNRDEESYRGWLVQNHRLHAALTLSDNMFESVSIGTCLLCIRQAEKPVLLDCTQNKKSSGKKFFYSDEQIAEIADIVDRQAEIDTALLAVIASPELIQQHNYNLRAVNYREPPCVTDDDLREVVADYMRWKIEQAIKHR